MPAPLLKISYLSSKEYFDLIYTLSVGEVFKYEYDLESLYARIYEDIPDGIDFSVRTVTPGTELYSLYGNSLVVVKNATITE